MSVDARPVVSAPVMQPLAVQDAYDVIVFSGQMQSRIAQVLADLDRLLGLRREKEWLVEATELLMREREPAELLLPYARQLPELGAARADYAKTCQAEWAAALEDLLSTITEKVSSRSPLIETLFPHQKLAPLGRADDVTARKFADEFDRRAQSSYAKRLLAQDEHAAIQDAVTQVANAFTRWQEALGPPPAESVATDNVREALLSAAGALEIAIRQARLIAEAALVPVPGIFESSGLRAKPKRRLSGAKLESPSPEPDGSTAPAKDLEEPAATPPHESQSVEEPAAAAPRKRRTARREGVASSAESPPGIDDPAQRRKAAAAQAASPAGVDAQPTNDGSPSDVGRKPTRRRKRAAEEASDTKDGHAALEFDDRGA